MIFADSWTSQRPQGFCRCTSLPPASFQFFEKVSPASGVGIAALICGYKGERSKGSLTLRLLSKMLVEGSFLEYMASSAIGFYPI